MPLEANNESRQLTTHARLFLFTEALKLYRHKLSEFEQTEILDYPEIYYMGLECNKVQGRIGSAQNNGYDDENGSYIKVCVHLGFLDSV